MFPSLCIRENHGTVLESKLTSATKTHILNKYTHFYSPRSKQQTIMKQQTNQTQAIFWSRDSSNYLNTLGNQFIPRKSQQRRRTGKHRVDLVMVDNLFLLPCHFHVFDPSFCNNQQFSKSLWFFSTILTNCCWTLTQFLSWKLFWLTHYWFPWQQFPLHVSIPQECFSFPCFSSNCWLCISTSAKLHKCRECWLETG